MVTIEILESAENGKLKKNPYIFSTQRIIANVLVYFSSSLLSIPGFYFILLEGRRRLGDKGRSQGEKSKAK